MLVKIKVNAKVIEKDVQANTLLIDFLRDSGMYSVKRGCETSNCGLCTVLVDGKAILSCNYLAARAVGKEVVTLEGLETEALEFGNFLADEAADQCGFCNPGFIMNVLCMCKELDNPSDDEIKEYLAGNLCRCTGYEGQLRAIRNYMESTRGGQQ